QPARGRDLPGRPGPPRPSGAVRTLQRVRHERDLQPGDAPAPLAARQASLPRRSDLLAGPVLDRARTAPAPWTERHLRRPRRRRGEHALTGHSEIDYGMEGQALAFGSGDPGNGFVLAPNLRYAWKTSARSKWDLGVREQLFFGIGAPRGSARAPN